MGGLFKQNLKQTHDNNIVIITLLYYSTYMYNTDKQQTRHENFDNGRRWTAAIGKH